VSVDIGGHPLDQGDLRHDGGGVAQNQSAVPAGAVADSTP
jgi:hypothetical protein